MQIFLDLCFPGNAYILYVAAFCHNHSSKLKKWQPKWNCSVLISYAYVCISFKHYCQLGFTMYTVLFSGILFCSFNNWIPLNIQQEVYTSTQILSFSRKCWADWLQLFASGSLMILLSDHSGVTQLAKDWWVIVICPPSLICHFLVN